MTSTIEQPRTAPDEDVVQRRHQNRTLKIAVLVIVVVAVAIGGGVLIYNGVTDDDTAADVPEGVLQVVDDFIAAIENADYEALRAVTTDDFARPEYFVDVEFGRAETFRWVRTHEFYERLLAAGPEYLISRVGDPLIYGDGPWFVSTAEVWETRTYDDRVGSGTGHKVVATYAIVDDDGVFKVADAYWAGYGMVPIDE